MCGDRKKNLDVCSSKKRSEKSAAEEENGASSCTVRGIAQHRQASLEATLTSLFLASEELKEGRILKLLEISCKDELCDAAKGKQKARLRGRSKSRSTAVDSDGVATAALFGAAEENVEQWGSPKLVRQTCRSSNLASFEPHFERKRSKIRGGVGGFLPPAVVGRC